LKNPGGWVNKTSLPNLITKTRLAATPVLLLMAIIQWRQAFAWLLILALLSDFLDGWLARKWQCESDQGATLDSIADIVLMGTVIVSIWLLHPDVYTGHWQIIAAVVVLWTIAHLAALLRYGRPASFHTRLLQVGIGLFALFSLVLFTYGFIPVLLYLAGVVSFIGGIEQLVMLALLPEWTPDLRGGIREALKQRAEASETK
jgi:CDP-diacylglycerol--glycerol-3-phosphate 3-phosphatidyltransferase